MPRVRQRAKPKGLSLAAPQRHPSPGRAWRVHWAADVGDAVIALKWSPHGGQLAAASVSGPVGIWGPDGRPLHALPGHAFGTMALDWHPAGAWLASAGQDGRVKIWHPAEGELAAEAPGGAAWVEHLAWSPSGRHLAAAAGRKLRLWDAHAQPLQNYPDAASTIAGLAWQPGAEVLAAVGYGGLTLWSPAQADPLRRYAWQGSSLALAWSFDGAFIATGDQDSTVHFWHVPSGKDLQMWGYPTKVRELAWDPTSRYLATGGGEQVVVWDCHTPGPAGPSPEGSRPIMLSAHKAFLTALAFQPAGPLLASAGQDGLVAVWDLAQPRKPLAQWRQPAPVSQLAWSPDGAGLAVGGEDGRVTALLLD